MRARSEEKKNAIICLKYNKKYCKNALMVLYSQVQASVKEAAVGMVNVC